MHCTDRSTGDSLGPLSAISFTGKACAISRVVGTLEYPVHAMNLVDTLYLVRDRYPDHLVVSSGRVCGKNLPCGVL